MLRSLIALLCLALASSCAAGAATTSTPPACSVSAADRVWIDRALAAWHVTAREITGIRRVDNFRAIFFNADCVLTSDAALMGGDPAWSAAAHQGMIPMPDGSQMPAAVASFAGAHEGVAYFVMSTPSVWRTAGVEGAGLDLETLMIAVMLHESSHVSQTATYGARVTALTERYGLGDDFDDNAVQARFGDDAAFSASVARETDLFFQAAAAPDVAAARRLAGEARTMMRARATRWFVGDDAKFAEAEDLWLTFEGSGQWAGYHWLVSPRGAGLSEAVAMPGFARRGRQWSQTEGIAIALAMDRIAPGWNRHAFGDGAQTMLQMLDAALAA